MNLRSTPRPRSASARYALCTLLLLLLAVGVRPAAAQGPTPEEVVEELIDEARREGHVEIGVRLVFPAELPPTRTMREELDLRKALVAKRRKLFLKDLAETRAEVTGWAKYAPQVYMRADEATLRYLLKHPSVERIYKNRAYRLMH